MLNKLRILLADDEAILRLDLREMLADAGHEIVGEAANGQEAVKLAAELKPDFIIMDVKMPIMDGMQLIEKCQSQEHPPLFILLTSYEEFALVKQAISYQVLDYLVKLELTEDVLNAGRYFCEFDRRTFRRA